VLALSVLTVVGTPLLAARFADRTWPSALFVGATGAARALGVELEELEARGGPTERFQDHTKPDSRKSPS